MSHETIANSVLNFESHSLFSNNPVTMKGTLYDAIFGGGAVGTRNLFQYSPYWEGVSSMNSYDVSM